MDEKIGNTYSWNGILCFYANTQLQVIKNLVAATDGVDASFASVVIKANLFK